VSRRNTLMLLALTAVWGASFLFIKVGVRDFSPSTLICLRCGFAVLTLLPILLVTSGAREAVAAARPRLVPLAVVGIVNTAVPFFLITWGEQYVDSGLAAILNASSVLFAALFALALYRDQRVTGLRLAGVLVGFAGVVLLVGAQPGGGHRAVAGALAIVGAAVCYGWAALYTGRRLRGTPPLVVATGSTLAATLVSLPPALLQLPTSMPGWKEWASVVALGVLGTGIGYLLYYGLIAGAGAARAILVTYLVPPMALVYGALILDEPVTATSLGGLALILGGVALGTGAVGVARLRREASLQR
jgi:drug/metabolite transporter (DMT)-like permease